MNDPIAETPSSDQPGGFGFFVKCERAWARCRRFLLRKFCQSYVTRMKSLQVGACTAHGQDVVDSRDLKFIRSTCGIRFPSESDPYAWREATGFARYGYAELVGFSAIIAPLMLAAAHFAWCQHWAFWLPTFAFALLEAEIVWFFRDPERKIPADPEAIVSPADGTITHVETIRDPDFPAEVLRISIFLSIFNVHVNRMPRPGRVTKVQYFRGQFLDARHSECATRNEQLWLDMTETGTATPMRIKQISGAIARRIVCWAAPGDEFATGQRYGMIKFGSRTDLLIPRERIREVLVKVGDKVQGAATTLAR